MLIISVSSIVILQNDDPSREELLSKVEQLIIEGRTFHMEIFLWRDFQPGDCPVDGRPLIAVVRVIPNDSFPFHPSLDADRMWVISAEGIWDTSFSTEELPPEENYLIKIARDGPKWDTGITIDVVIRIKDSNNVYFLRAANQTIHMTS